MTLQIDERERKVLLLALQMMLDNNEHANLHTPKAFTTICEKLRSPNRNKLGYVVK